MTKRGVLVLSKVPTWRLWIDDMRFKLRHWRVLNRLDCPKSPMEIVSTIETFQFGMDKYSYQNGKIKRISK